MKRYRWLVITGSVILSLAACEVMVRYTFLPLSSLHNGAVNVPDARGYALRPGASVEFRGIHEPLPQPVQWIINKQGLRADRTDSLPRISAKKRIAVFGDSEVFGWSVNYENTFESVMMHEDPSLEVLNFGVPGYNAENIADHVERMAPGFSLDGMIYLINPNDLDPPLAYREATIDSELLRRIAFAYMSLTETDYIEHRKSDSVRIGFLKQVDRIVQYAQTHHIPLMLVCMNEDELRLLSDKRPLTGEATVKAISVHDVFTQSPKWDVHLSASGHHTLGQRMLSEWRNFASGLPMKDSKTLANN